MSTTRFVTATIAVLPLVLSGCELAPKVSKQTGFRGTGMAQVTNTGIVAEQAAVPANAYETPDDSGPRASATYQNVQVLGNVSTDRFNHLMANMNNWVVPAAGLPVEQQGCNYCHNPANMAADTYPDGKPIYTKVVARRMIQMTQSINANWSNHVQQTGVTCWTCHRGNAIPANYWTLSSTPRGERASIVGNKFGQNTPNSAVGYSSLPYDPFEHYLRGAADQGSGGPDAIRIASDSQHPSLDHVVSIKDAEKSYGLMMHVSQSLGVNCTYCHNSQSFRAWNLSSAQRGTAYYGIRMVGNINDEYLRELASVFPAVRKGPQGDVFKVNCLTCHQGLAKPMNGVSMLPEHPTLGRPAPGAAPPTAVTVPAATSLVAAAVR